MAFSPAWGGMSPIPVVKQGALRDWLEKVRGIRTNPQVLAGVVATPASISRSVVMALASTGFMAAYARIVGVAPQGIDSEQLFRDIQMFLRSKRGVQTRTGPRGSGRRKGAPPMAPVPLEPPDLEDLGFFSWIERRRYRDGEYFTPFVRGTI